MNSKQLAQFEKHMQLGEWERRIVRRVGAELDAQKWAVARLVREREAAAERHQRQLAHERARQESETMRVVLTALVGSTQHTMQVSVILAKNVSKSRKTYQFINLLIRAQ